MVKVIDFLSKKKDKDLKRQEEEADKALLKRMEQKKKETCTARFKFENITKKEHDEIKRILCNSGIEFEEEIEDKSDSNLVRIKYSKEIIIKKTSWFLMCEVIAKIKNDYQNLDFIPNVNKSSHINKI